MPELVKQVAGAVTQDLVVSRTGTGRVFYTARLQYATPTPPAAGGSRHPDRAPLSELHSDALGPASTTFAEGDLVRVTLS